MVKELHGNHVVLWHFEVPHLKIYFIHGEGISCPQDLERYLDYLDSTLEVKIASPTIPTLLSWVALLYTRVFWTCNFVEAGPIKNHCGYQLVS